MAARLDMFGRMRILVTTALGNVGRAAMIECATRGHGVRAAHREVEAARLVYPAAEVALFDFLDPSTWTAALDGCSGLVLVRPPPIADMASTLIPFVDAAYAAGVEHIVFISVAGAERMTWVPHRKVELHLMSVGRSWTILRPGFFAQNLADAYRRDIVEDARLFVPADDARVAFLDGQDIGAVAARVFDAPEAFQRRALWLTGPEAITFTDVARMLSEVTERQIRYVPASLAGYAWHLRTRRSMSFTQIGVQTILHYGLRRGDAEAVDPTIEQVLGRPARSLHSFIARHAALWRP